MVLLGFADDVLDLPWRYKLLLPTIASLPLLANYHAYHGLTTVVVPSPLRALLAAADGSGLTWLGRLVELVGLADVNEASGGRIVDLGLVYLVYMGLLAVFATNAINIYAGVNGLEAGQAAVIGIAILTANMFELASGAEADHAYHHLLSAGLGLPFVATTAGLLAHNVFPAKVFVGDTFCYFAGMTFAVMGILGHFSKTLLLFLLPQILNFVYSLPQLFKVYPCPRHRLPEYDAALNVMRPSTFEVPAPAVAAATPAKAAAAPVAAEGAAAASSGGARKRRGSVAGTRGGSVKEPESVRSSSSDAAAGSGAAVSGASSPAAAVVAVRRDNMTLINLTLRVLGPMSERQLTNTLLVVQVLSCALGLGVRYWVSDFLFETKG
jgi:UDP-N-acetylmuramyl pentapeptide phosphotransferase/UDP-N-acetylglucosamine-1-phosphate transferase